MKNKSFYDKISANDQLRERLEQDLLDFLYEEQGNKYN